jgi:hypothetical protein
VVDDVCVRVVEPRQDRGAMQAHDPSPSPAQAHHLSAAGGLHHPTRDGEVAYESQPAPAERADAPAGEDQVSVHGINTVRT